LVAVAFVSGESIENVVQHSQREAAGYSIENVLQHFQREAAKVKTVTLETNGRVTKKQRC